MDEIYFIKLEEVIAVNEDQIKKFGGTFGIRDQGLLESAIYFPQASFSKKYLHQNLFEMAAAYLNGIIKNHPFIDGNKRTGLIIALLFLENNGIEINMSQQQAYNLAVNIATSKIDLLQVVKILEKKATFLKMV